MKKPMNNDVFVLCSARTPMGKYGGSFKDLKIVDLSSQLIIGVCKKYNINPVDIDNLIVGNVIQANTGQNVAREIIYKRGMKDVATGYTVNEVCASGMKAVINAAKDIKLGEANLIAACGVENMSRAPFMMSERFGIKIGGSKLTDSLLIDGLHCGVSNQLMGNTAENLAKKYKISRKNQDEFAYESHMKTIKATDSKEFADEIISILVKDVEVNKDETFRRDTSIEALSKLRPAFEEKGTVTAGNSSSLADGASVAMIGSRETAGKINIKPNIRIVGWSSTGGDPNYMGITPVKAVKSLLKKNDLTINEIDLFEINEAFAVQAIAVIRELKINPSKVNVNGGAIALGHPLGCSGVRIITTLMYKMLRNNSHYGIAALCVGGGEGYALLLENVAD